MVLFPRPKELCDHRGAEDAAVDAVPRHAGGDPICSVERDAWARGMSVVCVQRAFFVQADWELLFFFLVLLLVVLLFACPCAFQYEMVAPAKYAVLFATF